MTTTEKEEVFDFLDELRESGATNMFGAAPYLRREFGFTKDEARDLLGEWMQTFSKRQAAKKGGGIC